MAGKEPAPRVREDGRYEQERLHMLVGTARNPAHDARGSGRHGYFAGPSAGVEAPRSRRAGIIVRHFAYGQALGHERAERRSEGDLPATARIVHADQHSG